MSRPPMEPDGIVKFSNTCNSEQNFMFFHFNGNLARTEFKVRIII